MLDVLGSEGGLRGERLTVQGTISLVSGRRRSGSGTDHGLTVEEGDGGAVLGDHLLEEQLRIAVAGPALAFV